MAEARIQPGCNGAERLAVLLDSREVIALIDDLEATRWTGRPGHPIRTMVAMFPVKSLYVLPVWTRTVRLVTEHEALQLVLGCRPFRGSLP
jgi:hypothetical protein